jgi:hypothetical protein
VTERSGIAAFLAAVNAKDGGRVSTEFLDPEVNGTFAVTPTTVVALTGAGFAGSPTRWRFPATQ